MDIELLDALHHGKGVSGNTQMLRTQEVILDDGTQARVPFVSGNSVKHMIRSGAVRFALDAMGVEDGSLSKAVVDLLFSAGHLGKGSQSVRIATAREMSALFPALSLCGYSAGNTMVASKLRVDNLHVVCRENASRLPSRVAESPHARLPQGAYRSEEFGTRHESTRLPHVSRLLLDDDRARRDAAAGSKLEDAKPARKDAESAQMIYEFQVLKAGTRMWGGIGFEDLTPSELVAFRAGLSYACVGTHPTGRYIFGLGAKNSIGWGRVAVAFRGSMRVVDAPTYVASDAAVPTMAKADDGQDAELAVYADGLRDNRGAILAALGAVA